MTESQTFAVGGLVAPHPLAAAAGRDVLIEGGTLIEAALAVAAVAAVVVPHRNGLGGDALWLIREAGSRGRVRVLDARGLTGRLASAVRLRDLGHDAVPHLGPEAVLAVPGVVAGWAEVQALATALGGRLPFARLLAPAIAAARDGFDPRLRDAQALAAAASHAELPGFAETFLVDGRLPAAGTPWRFPKLAETLDYLGRGRLDDLYRGDVACELAKDLDACGCPLDRDDLRRCEPRWRSPEALDLGRETIEIAPQAPAVTAAVALGLFASLGPLRPESFEAWHGLIESLNLAPPTIAAAALDGGEIAALLDRDGLKRAAERIDRTRASRPSSSLRRPFPEDAVFIGAVDRDGAAVALVQTLGGAWGSGVVSGRTGILLGNRGAALALDPARGPTLAPGRRVPLLSMPMVLSGRSGRVASLGATGPHAGSLVSQVAARLLAGASPEAAVAAPRFTVEPAPDGDQAVLVEADREPEPASRLKAAGHRLLSGASSRHRMLGLAVRLPSARIEGLSDDGDEGVAGL